MLIPSPPPAAPLAQALARLRTGNALRRARHCAQSALAALLNRHFLTLFAAIERLLDL